MKHGWCEKIKNTVCYHQTPFNIALIVEKMLNTNVDLTEKVNMMIDEKTSNGIVARIIRLIK